MITVYIEFVVSKDEVFQARFSRYVENEKAKEKVYNQFKAILTDEKGYRIEVKIQ